MRRNIFGFILVVTLVCLFFACEGKKSGTAESASGNNSNGSAKSENISKDSAKIENGGLITIKEARELVSKNEFIQPEEGMKFVGFDIFIDNEKGKSDISLNLFLGSFEIKDSEGFTYTPGIWDVAEPKIDVNGTIEKGDVLRGWITVEVKKNTVLSNLRIRLNTANTKSGWINIQ
ncbi:hypothetical protein R84B8_02308 [Treponema sp. R8-4-B8]